MELSYFDLVQKCHCIAFQSSLNDWLKSNVPEAQYLFVKDQKVGVILSNEVIQACIQAGFVCKSSNELAFPDSLISMEERTQFLLKVCEGWHQAKVFPCLLGWRNELYSVYGKQGELLFQIERAAAGLFGVRTYGCHMTAFRMDPVSYRPTHVWVAQRSPTKATYPNMLDNSVAGGLTSLCTPTEVMRKECEEEAGQIPITLAPTSEISYFTTPDLKAKKELNPETQFVFDARVDETWKPRPIDGEVAKFHLYSISECEKALKLGKFKPNCALVLIDFFTRHSIITPENTESFLDIVHGIHRPLEWEFPGPKTFPVLK